MTIMVVTIWNGWWCRKPDTMCEARNLVIDFSKMHYKTDTEFDSGGSNKHFDFQPGSPASLSFLSWIWYDVKHLSRFSLYIFVGTFSAQCKINRSIYTSTDRTFGGENKFIKAIWNNLQEVNENQHIECDHTISNPTILLMRFVCFVNMFSK